MSANASLRLRAVHLFNDENGATQLIYDLERTMIFAVPSEWQNESIARAVRRSTGLENWLVENDLLTASPRKNWSEPEDTPLPTISDLSLDMSGACNMGCVYCFEKPINSRIGSMSEDIALASLDFFFKKNAGAPKVALHFGSGEPLLRFELLKIIVAEAERRAAINGQQITFDLTTNATLINTERALFLNNHPFNVRISCDGPAHLHNHFRPMLNGGESYQAVERGLKMLLEHLGERVTINSVISGGTRLSEVWAWAKEMGLRHYHVIKVGAENTADLNLRNSELLEFRDDLNAVCADLLVDLRAGRVPIDYQPITKVVRRLMIPQPITRFCGVAATYLGVAANGKVYPCFRHLGLRDYELGDVRSGVDDSKRSRFRHREAADVDRRPICSECWARYLCGGGCYADSTVYGPDKLNPQVQHCPFWRTEIEVAIRFYHELVAENPAYCLRLFGDDPDEMSLLEEGNAAFLNTKNCS
jgi:uncharacterized protein